MRIASLRIGWEALLFVAICLTTGCGKVPLLSPNREGFPPWEKLPEGNGVRYVEKFIDDSGIDPLYLAKISYDDEAALKRVIDTFGLVTHDGHSDVESFAKVMRNQPSWFPLSRVSETYTFPSDGSEYLANLWVDAGSKIAVLERAWW